MSMKHVDFVMPDLGLGTSATSVGLWLVDVGAAVLCGDGLLEVNAEGVSIELPAPVEGVLQKVFVQEDDLLTPGTRLARITVADSHVEL
jgi:pyruvate/2-oxoglutarate dehydrogenase complex dihydrolipoamide acyltransferase (E2) component